MPSLLKAGLFDTFHRSMGTVRHVSLEDGEGSGLHCPTAHMDRDIWWSFKALSDHATLDGNRNEGKVSNMAGR